MGMFIRKSFKVGGVRLNLSKSGLGFSTGVKGLRLGVDSRGKSYVAGGRHGLYFKENLSGGKSRKQTQATNSSRSGTGFIIFLFIIGIIIIINNPDFLWLIGLVFVVVIFIKILNIIKKKKMNKLEMLIIQNMQNENFLEFEKNMNLIMKKYKKKDVTKLFINTYISFINLIISDMKISDPEMKILLEYQKRIPNEMSEKLNIQVLNQVFEFVIKDEIIDKKEKTLLNALLDNLVLVEDEKFLFRESITEYEILNSIMKNDLNTVNSTININAENIFYEGEIEIYKTKKIKNENTFILDQSGKIIIGEKYIHLIANGHRKIKLTDVLELMFNKIQPKITLIIQNRKTPIYINPKEAVLVYGTMKKVYLKACNIA